jgi:hypothetical protein
MSKESLEEDKRLRENDYQESGLRLIESWEKKAGMELDNGVIAEMADKDIYKTISLVKMLKLKKALGRLQKNWVKLILIIIN